MSFPKKLTRKKWTQIEKRGPNSLPRPWKHLHLNERKILGVNTLLKEGDPKTTVCKVADEIETDLIIMGSRGLRRLRSIFENSVSQYVFQLSSRPMLLVKDDIFIKRVKRVMVALENSASSQEALALAIRMIRDIPDAKLQLTRVSKTFPNRAKLSVEDAKQDPAFADAINRAKRENLKFQCFSGKGKPGDEISTLADEFNSDLIVMGSPDRRPSVARNLVDIDRLLGSSVSDSVRIQTPCPVLFVRKAE